MADYVKAQLLKTVVARIIFFGIAISEGMKK
jgi:hypothetical protein